MANRPARPRAKDILCGAKEHSAKLAEAMPTELDAIRAMQDAYIRLKDLGWRDAIYCPKDGSIFDAIEVGSTGIHACSYMGDWPTGTWWVHAAHDLWPSRPVLFRISPTPSTPLTSGEG